MFKNSKRETPTALAEMASPVPTFMGKSPSARSFHESRSYKEEQTWLVAPESTIHVDLSSSTNKDSITSKSYLPEVFFSLSSTRYLGQFLFQCLSLLQWKHFPLGLETLELFLFRRFNNICLSTRFRPVHHHGLINCELIKQLGESKRQLVHNIVALKLE